MDRKYISSLYLNAEQALNTTRSHLKLESINGIVDESNVFKKCG
ncbi:hypothetical protein P20495_0163 [Pseudoalteromonas sp. BSi20495]|nr:hypothetical protein P20495_0163 [Pseudoalteromonas sp. BSi20495]